MTDEDFCENLNAPSQRSPTTEVKEPPPRSTADWSRSAAKYIVKYPEISLGLALALGIGIALIVKRR